MTRTIHLIRHGEGYHNVSDENKDMRDPKLTDKGEDQCRHVRETFPHHDKLVRLMASPLTRTFQTCILSFRTPEVAKLCEPSAVIGFPSWQEVSDLPYDTGLPPADLKARFNGAVNLDNVPEDWFKKNTNKDWEEQEQQLFARGRTARSMLLKHIQDLPEDAHVGLASHGTFLHFATDDFSGVEPGMTTAWENTEWRSYQFSDKLGEHGAPILVETKESWARRHESDERPSKEEQETKRGYLLAKMKEDYHEK